jgi:ATP-binding protein involved in chromosome partitioning
VATIDDVRRELALVRYPGYARDIVTFGLLRDVAVRADAVAVEIVMPSTDAEVARALDESIRTAVARVPGVASVAVRLDPDPRGTERPRSNAPARAPLPGVAHIVAVASGKGGVGKSTVAVNLALALAHRGLRVGLLDADVHGPSVPLMTGAPDARPSMVEGKKILPIERFGIKLVSMGFFLDDRSPVIWRGPMVMSIVRQFLKDVVWGHLDVLVVDLPPGTGDAQLTLLQEVPVSGGVIVTTPQDIALQDVRRGIGMFATVQTPVLGVVENMSEYVCPHCGTHEPIFGADGGAREAEALQLDLIGRIPLVGELRESMDRGAPLVAEHRNHPVSIVFGGIAEQVAAALDARHDQAEPR